MKKFFIWVVLGILVFYIATCVVVFAYQKDLIFLPSQKIRSFPGDTNLKEVTIVTGDNTRLNAWYIDNKSQKTIIFFHGNGGNIYYNQERITLFQSLGVNALMLDYRGYGKSEWKIQKEDDIYQDAESAYKYILELGTKPENIIIWGQSLGGAIAIHTAQNKPIFGTIIESTFTSLDEKSRELYWFLPTQILLQFHFNSIEKIKNISSPVLVIHSEDDEMFDIKNGKKLFDTVKGTKEFLKTNGSHNGWFSQSYPLYKENLEKFLKISVGK